MGTGKRICGRSASFTAERYCGKTGLPNSRGRHCVQVTWVARAEHVIIRDDGASTPKDVLVETVVLR